MKTFKRLMSFALALLMLVSVIPLTTISARAAPKTDIPPVMLYNHVLRGMAYIGYDLEGHMESGKIYADIPSSTDYNNDAPFYDYDGSNSYANGEKTITDASTVTGKAPDVSYFKTNGLVCASYTTYYYFNYLPNIAGVDTSSLFNKFKLHQGTGSSYIGSFRAAPTWRIILEKIADDGSGDVKRLYYAECKEEGKKVDDATLNTLQLGDCITFGYLDENGNDVDSHVAIYLGKYNNKHFISHMVGEGLQIGIIDHMYYDQGPKTAAHVTGIYRFPDHTHYDTGKIEVYKKDPNGKALAGAVFEATNISTNEKFLIGPTDESGYAISQKELPYGTYKIVETVFPPGFTSDGTTEWVRTLDANTEKATITINAINIPKTGVGRIVKTSTNGGTVQGWWFYVWKVTDDGWVWNCRKQTDSNGVITLDLNPGRYVVREVKLSLYESEGLTVPSGVDPQYWVQDTSDKYLDITANGTATVTFNNSYYGKIKVQKSTNTGGDLAGWKFTILNSSGSLVATVTTDSNGVATSGNLAPGTYYVKEVDAPSNTDGWFMDITTSGGVVCANNLLVNSDFANGTKNWSGSNSTGVSVTTVDGKKVLKADPSVGAQDVGYVVQSVYRTGAGKYTLSADIYVEQDRKIYLAMWDASSGSWSGLGTTTKNLKAGWNHVEHTFNISKDCNLIIAGIGGAKSSGAFYLYHPKFVCGDTATPWAADRTVTVTAGSTATHNVKNVKGGKIAVQKNTNTGEYLSGWQFEVKDSSGKLITTLVTDVTGYAVSDILAPGTYSVTEVGNSNPDFNPDYWDMDNKPTRTVTISADTYTEIHTETYDNTHVGKGKIQKVTVNGGTVEGWRFQIWSVNPDSTRTWVGNYGTNAEGVIELSLLPGQYVIREQDLDTYGDYPLPEGVDPEYWECDYTDKDITIVAGETADVATFTNKLLGKIKVQKTTNTGGDLEGWVFAVKDADGNVVATITTNNEGKAETELLNPGTYTVTEVDGPDGLFGSADWFCDISETNGVVEVEAGSTVIHNVKNVKGGKIQVLKRTNTGANLSGWLFEVKDADGNVIAMLETDETGFATTVTLAPGEYTVTEIGNNNPDFNPDYWVMDENPSRTVTISDETYVEVTTALYINTNIGYGEIQKVSVNSSTIEGWMFHIWHWNETTRVWDDLGDYATDAEGKINLPLIPGSYRIEEFEFEEYGSYPLPEGVDPEYWTLDLHTTIANVKANETVQFRPFTNTLLGKLKIQKNTNTGGDLAGWVFEVKNAEGEVVTTLTTDENGVAESGLIAPGIYTVTEIGGPDGLWENSEWFCDISDTNGIVEVVAGETITHEVLNVKGGKIGVWKDTNTGYWLDGWLFEIRNADGELIEILETDDHGSANSKPLAPGVYTVTEIGHTDVEGFDPDLWIMDAVPTHEVVISADTYKEFTTVFYRNEGLGAGTIKKVVLNDGSVEGWNFKITDTNGNTVFEGETDAEGLLDFALSPGTYYIYETEVREFYVNDPAEYKVVEVVAHETAEVVTFTNTSVGKAHIVKQTNTDSDADRGGWIIGVYADPECTAENRIAELITATTTDSMTGEVVGEDWLYLEPGIYYLKEEGRADGSLVDSDGYKWILDEHIEEITVVAHEVVTATFTNTKTGVGKIVKIARNGSPEGWLFDIWRVTPDENEYIGEYQTDVNGEINVELIPGEYIVQEKIPENPNPFWQYDTEPRTVTVEVAETTTIGPFTNVFTGRGRVIKETNTDNNRDGWIFGVFTTPECTPDSLVTTVTSASQNEAKNQEEYGHAVFYLEPGTYWVKEIGSVDGKFASDNWVIDTSIKEIEIVAGDEAQAVTFYNEITNGYVSIVKKSTNGGTVIGWQFSITNNETYETKIVTITEEKEGVGVIEEALDAGTYTITEIGHSNPDFDDSCWVMDNEPKVVTVNAGDAAIVEYENKFKGILKVQKTLENPDNGTLEGWKFQIEKLKKDEMSGNYTVESTFTANTDSNGYITENIEPGTYRITELLDEDSPWVVVGENPKIVNVVAGETTTVPFVNRLNEGKIEIAKVDPDNHVLSGATFLLEWSEDGENWFPATYSEKVIKGGCTNENLVDGTLTTGESGIITFTGLHPMVQYRVTETKAPDNYLLLADYVYVGKLPADTLEVHRTVVNTPGYITPPTGVFGTTQFFAGMMLAFMTLAMFAIAGIYLVLSGSFAEKKNNFMKGSKPTMKKFTRIFTLLLALCLTISMAAPAFAATADTATIDPNAKGSIELYKYDMTAATDAGVFEQNSFVSTGTTNATAEDVLAPYAIQGVVFSYHKVADITTYSVTENNNGKYIVKNLYAMPDDEVTEDLLYAIGLDATAAYPVEEGEDGMLYFTSDVLSNALRSALASNSSTVKDLLMAFNANYDSPMFAETDATGHTKVDNLELGLYIIVENYVPEQVKQTTAPFFVSVPTTSNDGSEWLYNLTFYPKNETDYPDLDKTLRESKPDTGKHEGTSDEIDDGYASTGTASDGDVIDYQIISSLPTITSDATNLTCYDFLDTLSKGLEYNADKQDVKIEWFKDAACTELIATWTQADTTPKFSVTYGTADNDATTMLISMTEAGLAEINGSEAVYGNDSIYDGYSDCTIRITYTATINSSADVAYGDAGNPNEVVLTWKRTNTNYYDTLNDDCHVYVYGIDLTKEFEDGLGNYANVNFVMKNTTDNYWVVAEQDADTGIYYVTGHAETEAEATVFVPTEDGSIFVLGLEDDTYVITETDTDDGYMLLKDSITVVITAANDGVECDICGVKAVVASATINGDEVAMLENNGSANAVVALNVVNNRGYDMPQTGDEGTMMLTLCGTMLAVSTLGIIVLLMVGTKKKENEQ